MVAVVLGAGIAASSFRPEQFSRSTIPQRAAVNSMAKVSFADRFAVASELVLQPAASNAQLNQAKSSLTEALLAERKVAADGQQAIETPPAIPAVPVPKSRPSAADLAASSEAGTHSRQSTSVDADLKLALRKVFSPSGTTLASASPDGGVASDGTDLQSGTRTDRYTAVYDIAARTVYMPDGSRLEAHSGLGELMDDPLHVDVKDRGATPPNVYDLKLRERPFHGVQAIRMKPVGSGELFGRSGLLTHSYMMGPNGDSNGCVSFKDYDVFLQAFLRGDIKRLIVVKSLTDQPGFDTKRA